MLWLKYSQDHILSQVTCPQTQTDAYPFWCLSNSCPNPGGVGIVAETLGIWGPLIIKECT